MSILRTDIIPMTKTSQTILFIDRFGIYTVKGIFVKRTKKIIFSHSWHICSYLNRCPIHFIVNLIVHLLVN